jgi:hypothetical protein
LKRLQTACLMKSRIGSFKPVLITADFNSTAGGEIHQMLTTDFEDAWVAAERRSRTRRNAQRIRQTYQLPPHRLDFLPGAVAGVVGGDSFSHAG